jgi:hypothetical protein
MNNFGDGIRKKKSAVSEFAFTADPLYLGATIKSPSAVSSSSSRGANSLSAWNGSLWALPKRTIVTLWCRHQVTSSSSSSSSGWHSMPTTYERLVQANDVQ